MYIINDTPGATRTLRHDPIVNGCGGAFRGDWDTVTCDRCGMHVNTLDSVTSANLGPREIMELDGDRLVAVTR